MRTRVWAVGIFLVAGIVLFTVVLFLIGNEHEAFGSHYDVYADFANISGIGNGAQVSVAGFPAGKLSNIGVPKDPSGRFHLKLELNENMKPLVRQDSVVTIQSQGFIGAEFLEIKKGSPDSPQAAPGSTLPSKEPVELSALIAKASGMMDQVQGTIKDVHGKVDTALDSVTKTVNNTDSLITGVTGNIEQIAANGNRITGTVDQIVNGIQQGKGPVGMLLKGQDAEKQIRATLGNVQQATANLNSATAKVNGMMTEVQASDVIQKADATIENVRDLSKQLNDTMTQALGQDRIGQTGAANIRHMLSNMDQMTANMAADTESLKHEFFFRGFFKKRGFYTLQDLSPNDYRGDSKLAKEIHTRKWLTASELFEVGKDGKDRLSAEGMRVLDEVAPPFIENLPKDGMIIEGYSRATERSKQYLQGRERAILVRNYLEQHFHADHTHLGIVSLADAPPFDAGLSTWDGICLAVLKLN